MQQAETELERVLDRLADLLRGNAGLRECRGKAIEPINLFTQHSRVKRLEELLAAIAKKESHTGEILRKFFDALTVYLLQTGSGGTEPDWKPPISDEKRNVLDSFTELLEMLEKSLK